jgi:T5orf172 domain
MALLSKEQIVFLKSQGISPAQVFDASMTKSKADRESQMEALELSLYFGGAACSKAGHTLRTKAGHCIQCDTSKIAYQLRHSASGYVYLAYSQSRRLAKIGFTKNHPQERVDMLRREQYANAPDWELKKNIKYEKDAGRKEFAIHSLLEEHLKPISYEKYKGQMVECREVFTCDLPLAAKAFDQVTKP